jgi:acyl-CoA synthetase (AMP-forming)/AMP-acid ligase II
MHSQLSDGRAVVIQPSFSPEAFVEDIRKYIHLAYDLINPRYKINRLYVVPPILLALYHRVPHSKLQFDPPIDSICCAAAPLPKDIVPQLQKIWPTTLLRQGWGMTETATCITITPTGSPQGYSHTCGAIVPNGDCVIMDTETLTSIAPGQGQGELWVRSPSVTLGYIHNPSETAGMFNIGGEGWLRSGDEAEFEKGEVAVQGQTREAWLLCIRDRLKELIKAPPPISSPS